MKKLTFVLLMLVTGTMFAQSLAPAERAQFIKSWADYENTTIDTTIWIATASNGKSIAGMREVILIFTANDSAQAAVYINGRNSRIRYSTVSVRQKVYADSLSSILFLANGVTGFTATPFFGVVRLKDATVDRLIGCDNFRVAVDFTAASGDRVGRVCKLWLWTKE